MDDVGVIAAASSRMHNPPHPKEIIRKLCLDPLGLSVSAAARALRVSRKTLSGILNGRAGVSPEIRSRVSPHDWDNPT